MLLLRFSLSMRLDALQVLNAREFQRFMFQLQMLGVPLWQMAEAVLIARAVPKLMRAASQNNFARRAVLSTSSPRLARTILDHRRLP